MMPSIIKLVIAILNYIKSWLLLSNNVTELTAYVSEVASDVADCKADNNSVKAFSETLNNNMIKLNTYGSDAMIKYNEKITDKLDEMNDSIINIDKRLVRVETKLNGKNNYGAKLGESID